MLLQVLYSVRSERMLMEQIQCNMLFRWFAVFILRRISEMHETSMNKHS